VDGQWDRVIFSEESTFISANEGPVLVYRPRGERYNFQYVSTSTRSGRVSVHCWGWISHERAGILHRIEEHLDGLQYKHTLKHVMVSSVRVLYPDGVISSNKTIPPFTILVFFKNGYRGRPMSNSLTGHHERLI
jgi:hypothetical protein